MLLSAGCAPLAACASTPNLDAWLASEDGRLRRAILGAQLDLNARQEQALQTALTAAPGEDLLQRQLVLQQALSETPLVGGNAVELLQDGAQALPAMFAAIAQARDHVNLEFFILEDVACRGRRISEVLLDRLRHGVQVNIIYDAFGSRDTPAAMFDALRRAGAAVLPFNPLNPLKARAGWSPNDRDHRKIIVVDGKIGFTGGVNLDKVYENPPGSGIAADDAALQAYWHDTAVRIEGPAVAELQKLFFATWKQQKGPAPRPARYFPRLEPRGTQTIRVIGSAPGDRHPLYFISLMTAALSARQRLWLSTGYFVPPHEEREVFAKVARHGVDLRFVVPSQSDVQATVYAARAAYGDLLGAGARIYEMQTAVLHSKLATVDGVWSVVGSSNLDRRSVVFNNEIDVIILGRQTAARIEAVLRAYMRQSREITLAAWRRRPVAERLRELRARIWQYWM